ncbi:hypothetical protein BU14_1390s0001 [Porphyra umbilicalis]|uniref:Uncharacterized protein n=1 Tax=Porphyra umbilicalis TaxID=2786 RepID=A0A1X6NLS3_PORUM|nr:hypothetical protein BU14_1390s0001 [Porphyra umbilicalis]|eukprot:OSX69564.1 hypothetical protein BU14_1390s0001 [Porphyra umbilicalis]
MSWFIVALLLHVAHTNQNAWHCVVHRSLQKKSDNTVPSRSHAVPVLNRNSKCCANKNSLTLLKLTGRRCQHGNEVPPTQSSQECQNQVIRALTSTAAAQRGAAPSSPPEARVAAEPPSPEQQPYRAELRARRPPPPPTTRPRRARGAHAQRQRRSTAKKSRKRARARPRRRSAHGRPGRATAAR